MPTTLASPVLVSSAQWAMPKSVSLAVPSSATSTLPGVTSRWTILRSCMATSAAAICAPTPAAARGVSGPVVARVAAMLRAGKYSMTSHRSAPWTTTSYMLTTFGCCNPAAICASRRSCASFPPVDRLSATTRRSSESVARQTTPIPPAPICSSSR
ncbi:hypothetical protein DFQ13_104331 [Actinokineospora spheciospongiae]|nr:hypothetical protein [Actinokineospora spheciospongiae]PWW63341.1 hypothetical protein DFQ13_104331 [Actinokineospora spheciospongiae]